MSDSLLSVKVFNDGQLTEVLVFHEKPEKSEHIRYMGVIKLGKMSTSHIKMQDPKVSRMHGIIEQQDGAFSFSLMGKGDTLLNGKEIEDKIALHREDRLEVGAIKLVFYPGIDLTNESAEIGVVDAAETQTEEASIVEGGVREVVPSDSADTSSSVKPASDLLESDDLDSDYERRAGDRILNPYFNVELEDDDSVAKKSVGRGLEIKHYWQGSIVSAKLYRTPGIVTVGEEENCDFYIQKDLLPEHKKFVLSDPSNNKNFNVYFVPNKVHYIEGQDEYNLEELLQAHKAALKTDHYGAIRLLFKTKIAFEIGDNRFEISSLPVLAAASRFSFSTFKDMLNAKYNVVSIGLHLLLLAIIFLSPPDIDSFSIEKLNDIPERYARVILDVPKEKKVKKVIKFDKKVVAKKRGTNTKGKSKVKFDNLAFKNKSMTKKQMKIRRIVHSKGALGALNKSGLGRGGGAGGGIQDDNLRLTDNADISNGASGAPDVRGGGSGVGGGGGSIGVGGPSRGGRYGSYSGYKGVSGMRGRKVKRRLNVSARGGMITGNLTKSQIQRVVNKHLMEVRYCYESQLMRKPNLKGGLTIQWDINPQGAVVKAAVVGGSLKDRKVHSCLVQRIRRWKFPEPKGGGFARVRYPFNFSSN